MYRELRGSEGFGSTDPYRLHLGLGGATTIDELEIRWSSGVKQRWERAGMNQEITVREDGKE